MVRVTVRVRVRVRVTVRVTVRVRVRVRVAYLDLGAFTHRLFQVEPSGRSVYTLLECTCTIGAILYGPPVCGGPLLSSVCTVL